MNGPRPKWEQNLNWVVLLLLLLCCLAVLRPFVSALLWGIILSVSCWPAYLRLLKLTRSRRTLASLLLTGSMILIVLLPFAIVGLTLADNVDALTGAVRRWIEAGPPAPPAWLAKIPVVGAKAAETWQSVASDSATLLARLKEWIQPASVWLLKGGLVLGNGLIQLAMSILIAFFLFRDGVSVAARLRGAVEKISGERGQRLLIVAGNTIRGVVYGILGTALLQAVLLGIGLLIAGVPGAALLSLLCFFFSVVPVIGTGLVWLPAALWLFHQGSNGWGTFMIIWGLGVGQVDNFVKPWLISQGSDMPFILIFFGVIGGALTFGFIGVFLGPTVLAVGWRLMEEWGSSFSPPATEPTKGKAPAA